MALSDIALAGRALIRIGAAPVTSFNDGTAESAFVLTPGGLQLYVGTPHSWFTIYAAAPRVEIGEEKPFLEGYKRLTIPVLDSDGESAWPERFTPNDIAQKKHNTGPNKFASQMMLQPVNISEGRLNPALLRFYSDELVLSDELKGLYCGSKRMLSASAWWDPAFGNERGDNSVLAVVFTDEDGRYRLHRVAYLRPPQGKQTTDEATWQCRRIAAIARELHLPSVSLEINGVGRFLPGILRNEMTNARAGCTVEEITSTRPKDIRILESFDVALAARNLYAHDSVKKTPFMMELQEWQPGRSKGHDDGLDAVAGALSREPVRLPRLHGAPGRQNWAGGGASHTAKTDFEV